MHNTGSTYDIWSLDSPKIGPRGGSHLNTEFSLRAAFKLLGSNPSNFLWEGHSSATVFTSRGNLSLSSAACLTVFLNTSCGAGRVQSGAAPRVFVELTNDKE